MKNDMSEMTLVSRRIVRDYLKANCLETYDVEISNSLHKSVKSAASKHHSYLKEKQEEEAEIKKRTEVRDKLKSLNTDS